MRRIRTVAVFPTVFTLGNLVCGFFAIVVAARVDRPTSLGNPPRRRYRVPASDAGHGSVRPDRRHAQCHAQRLADFHGDAVRRARRTRGPVGPHDQRLWRRNSTACATWCRSGWRRAFCWSRCVRAFTYSHDQVWIIAARSRPVRALRLARFNVETTEDDDHLHFSGLPSPAAAASIAGFAILFYELRREGNTLVYAAKLDAAVQTVLPFFAPDRGRADGLPNSLSARRQPGVARAAQFRARRGAGLRRGRDHVDPRLLGAHHRAVSSCFGRRCKYRVAASLPAPRRTRSDFLIRSPERKYVHGLVEHWQSCERSIPVRPASG